MKDEIRAVLEDSYVLKRITAKQRKSLEKRYNIETRSRELRDLLSNDTDDLLGLLGAAAEAISLAGETASGQKDRLQEQAHLDKQSEKLTHDEAGYLTVVQNLEIFFRKPEEAQAFVDALDDEAKENLRVALGD